MLLALFFVGLGLGGGGLSSRLWRTVEKTTFGPAERVASGLTMTIAIWVALTWTLAAVHAIGSFGLVTGACVLGAVGCWLLAPGFRGLLRREFFVKETRAAAIGLIAAGALPVIWVAVISWRGTVLPPLNHDAFAYHLTKAVLILREGGYAFFPNQDPRISSWPSNYEMLLAGVLAIDGTDDVTEWISGLSYVYFLALAGAMAERWWGTGKHVLGATLLAGSMPVALLHSGQHKNDLLVCATIVGAILWTARWSAGGGAPSLLLAVVSLLLACGTKLHGIFACAAVGPFLILGAVLRWRAGRRLSLRALAAGSGITVALALLLGNATYLVSLRHTGAPFGVGSGGQGGTYGDWANLWQFPYLAFGAPFAAGDSAVWVPWQHQLWYWGRYDFFYSNYGAAITVVLALVPFAAWRFGGSGRSPQRLERMAGTIMGVVGFLLILPLRTRPVGFFASFVRYTMFLVPIIACWSVAPWLRASFVSRRWSWAGWILLAVLGLDYGREAYLAGTHDVTAPVSYVVDLVLRPERRRLPFNQRFRAAFFVDRVAAPTAHVAFDGDFDSWTYPAYGEGLTRHVTFLMPSGDAAPAIPEDADWVVVDRSWSCFFGNPGFKTFGDWWTYLGKGMPTPRDVRVTELLERDPRFRLVYSVKPFNQAVFLRLREGAGAPPSPIPEDRVAP